jgi:hypothetical protein
MTGSTNVSMSEAESVGLRPLWNLVRASRRYSRSVEVRSGPVTESGREDRPHITLIPPP